MDLGVQGRIAVVSGADSGIGFHTAERLVAEGARVVMTDQYPQELEESAARISASEGALFTFPADVTNKHALADLYEFVSSHVGTVDILVHCAGITGEQGRFDEISDEGWVEAIDVNLLGTVRMVRTFIRDLRANGWGRVVLLASEDAV